MIHVTVKKKTSKPSVVSGPPSELGTRILLVDPDPRERERVQTDLVSRGYDVVTAESADQALAASSEWFPQVVVLAASLGASACRTLKGDDLLAHIPVVFYSREPTDEATVIAGLEAGANDYLFPPCSPALLAARIAAQVAIYRTQLTLRDRMVRDELTGVFSRRYLFESMRQHVSRFSRPGPPVLACLMIDVDHFKSINDRFGHLEGDRILRDVAGLIYGMTRKGDVVARFGGEEFVVILPSTTSEGANHVAEKLRNAVKKGLASVGVTISLGVSWYESSGESWKDVPGDDDVINLLLARADEALYRAKRAGRDRVCLQTDFPGQDRRNEARLGVQLKVHVIHRKGTSDHLAEVSAGGMSVIGLDLQVGEALTAHLPLDPPLTVPGRVIWSRVGTACGVAFEHVSDTGHAQLVRSLGQHTRSSRRRAGSSRGKTRS